MKPIIAPTDFSPSSLNAVNYAADLAVAIDSSLLLVHIVQLPLAYGEMTLAAINVDQQIANADENMKEVKRKITFRTNGKINIGVEVRTSGSIVEEIETYCKSIRPSFVVMGSHGRTAMDRLLFGSNTITAMRKLSWPLIVVPQKASFKKPLNIGFACDLKDVAETVPDHDIRTLVQHFDAKLHVIHVNTDNEKNYSSDLIDQSGQLSEMFEDLHPVYYFLNNDSIDHGLSNYAEKNNLDLLIVIPKTHGIAGKLFHKSQAKQLILHTHIPVLSVHE